MPNDEEVGRNISARSLPESSRDGRDVRRTFLRTLHSACLALSYREGKATELSGRNVVVLQKWIDDLDSRHRLTGIQVLCEHSGALLLLGRRKNQAVPK